MSQNSVGQTKLQLPIAKAVGAQHSMPSATPGTAQPSVAVPPASSLTINGVRTAKIDVTTMSGDQVVAAINNAGIAGVTASIDGAGRLVISGVTSIDGDGNLRALLGV